MADKDLPPLIDPSLRGPIDPLPNRSSKSISDMLKEDQRRLEELLTNPPNTMSPERRDELREFYQQFNPPVPGVFLQSPVQVASRHDQMLDVPARDPAIQAARSVPSMQAMQAMLASVPLEQARELERAIAAKELWGNIPLEQARELERSYMQALAEQDREAAREPAFANQSIAPALAALDPLDAPAPDFSGIDYGPIERSDLPEISIDYDPVAAAREAEAYEAFENNRGIAFSNLSTPSVSRTASFASPALGQAMAEIASREAEQEAAMETARGTAFSSLSAPSLSNVASFASPAIGIAAQELAAREQEELDAMLGPVPDVFDGLETPDRTAAFAPPSFAGPAMQSALAQQAVASPEYAQALAQQYAEPPPGVPVEEEVIAAPPVAPAAPPQFGIDWSDLKAQIARTRELLDQIEKDREALARTREEMTVLANQLENMEPPSLAPEYGRLSELQAQGLFSDALQSALASQAAFGVDPFGGIGSSIDFGTGFGPGEGEVTSDEVGSIANTPGMGAASLTASALGIDDFGSFFDATPGFDMDDSVVSTADITGSEGDDESDEETADISIGMFGGFDVDDTSVAASDVDADDAGVDAGSAGDTSGSDGGDGGGFGGGDLSDDGSFGPSDMGWNRGGRVTKKAKAKNKSRGLAARPYVC